MMFKRRGLKRFYKPTLMKITFWVLFFSIINLILSFIKDFAFIPCKKLIEEEVVWGLCPLDPAVIENTMYFGLEGAHIIYLNFIWPILFIVVIGVFLPYTISCALVEGWKKYVKDSYQ